ncbi:MAG: 50S ribosomal protein L21 [Candidatus Dadabacteria bacterium]|nr:MAG: 50S ribosomal protein L21 [Candidatus Dadabacteria bacterium]
MSENNTFAVIQSGGKQYRVSPGQQILVERLDGENGDMLEIKEVLMARADGAEIKVGTPYVEGAVVKAKIIATEKGRKVIVFKKRRRQGYMKKQGHRQLLTKLAIERIEV